MWLKQAANSVWNATKNMVTDTRTPARKLLDEIYDNQEEIMPTSKLNELASLTYDLQAFQEIVDVLIERIRVFKYDLDEAHKNLNMLIVVNYLIKHGASAFVDELREYIPTFKKYQSLQELKTYEDEQKQGRLNYQLQKIKSRAQHIQTLLEDKQKLLKQKQLSMLIKQKLKLYQKQKMDSMAGDYSSKGSEKSKSHQEQERQMGLRMNKIDWMMEKYLWQYVDKLDGKLEEVSDKFMTKVDKYIIGQIPQKFELEDDHEEEEGGEAEESPAKIAQNYKPLNEGQDDLMDRLDAQLGEGVNVPADSNLLQFEEYDEEEEKKKKKESQAPKNEQLI